MKPFPRFIQKFLSVVSVKCYKKLGLLMFALSQLKHYLTFILAKTGHWPNVVLMLGQRRRRWPSLKAILGQWPTSSGTPASISTVRHEVGVDHQATTIPRPPDELSSLCSHAVAILLWPASGSLVVGHVARRLLSGPLPSDCHCAPWARPRTISQRRTYKNAGLAMGQY